MTTATKNAPGTEAGRAAEGNGLAPRPNCAACHKPLRPHLTRRDREPTADELAHERACKAERDAAHEAMRDLYNSDQLSTDEANRRDAAITRRYEQRRQLTVGVVVNLNEYSKVTKPVAVVNVRTGWGNYGDNTFCGLRCGYEYGLAIATEMRRRRVAAGTPAKVTR